MNPLEVSFSSSRMLGSNSLSDSFAAANSLHLSRSFEHYVSKLNTSSSFSANEHDIPLVSVLPSPISSEKLPSINFQSSLASFQWKDCSFPMSRVQETRSDYPYLSPPVIPTPQPRSPFIQEPIEAEIVHPSSERTTPTSQNKFICKWGTCRAAFWTRTGLATHCSEHLTPYNGPKRRRVDITCQWQGCDTIVHSLYQLGRHLSQESHLGQTPFLMKQEEDSLSLQERAGKKIFPCTHPGCKKMFADSSNRKKHERTHSANRERFHCKEPGCTKSYSTKTDLNLHIKTHRQDFPHKCSHPNCKKAFVRVSELYAHERTHDNIMPHCCNRCGKRFREKARLRRHQESARLCVPKHFSPFPSSAM